MEQRQDVTVTMSSDHEKVTRGAAHPGRKRRVRIAVPAVMFLILGVVYITYMGFTREVQRSMMSTMTITQDLGLKTQQPRQQNKGGEVSVPEYGMVTDRMSLSGYRIMRNKINALNNRVMTGGASAPTYRILTTRELVLKYQVITTKIPVPKYLVVATKAPAPKHLVVPSKTPSSKYLVVPTRTPAPKYRVMAVTNKTPVPKHGAATEKASQSVQQTAANTPTKKQRLLLNSRDSTTPKKTPIQTTPNTKQRQKAVSKVSVQPTKPQGKETTTVRPVPQQKTASGTPQVRKGIVRSKAISKQKQIPKGVTPKARQQTSRSKEAAVAKTFTGKNSTLRFLVLGDWGGMDAVPHVSPIQRVVAASMAQYAHTNPVDFVVSVGDNFYNGGVRSTRDPRFKDTFEDAFKARSLNVPWYSVMGNHDHYGNIQAQIDYSKVSKRWTMPAFNFSVTYELPSSQSQITLLFVDTIKLCGLSGVHFLDEQPLGPAPKDKYTAEQIWSWINQTLATSNSEYLVFVGHYPVFSAAFHHSTQCLLKRLLPMLHKYKVTAAFGGHDHNLQHNSYRRDNWTVHYFVVGHGAIADNTKKDFTGKPAAKCHFFWAEPRISAGAGGFASLDVHEDYTSLSMINSKGHILYRTKIYPRFKRKRTPALRQNQNSISLKDKLHRSRIVFKSWTLGNS